MLRRSFILASASGLLGASVPFLPALASRGKRRDITLFLAGDVMTGRGIDQILPVPGDPTLHQRDVKDARDYVRWAEELHGPIPRPAGFDYIWGDALGVCEEARPDLRIVNLETAVTSRSAHLRNRPIHFRMNPGNVPCLQAAGIDACSLANNHALDWMQTGLDDTRRYLREAGIATAGAGPDAEAAFAPAILPVDDRCRVRFYALAATSSGVEPFMQATAGRPGLAIVAEYLPDSLNTLTDRIRREKQKGDLVVVSIHWGGNWGYSIPQAHRTFAKELIAAGTDVVHGHSSHHAKGIEVIGNRPVLYGCGDFIDDYEGIPAKPVDPERRSKYRHELILMYFVTLDRYSGQLKSMRMRPMRIRNFRLQHASAEEAAWLQARLDRECRKLSTSVAGRDDGYLHLGWTA